MAGAEADGRKAMAEPMPAEDDHGGTVSALARGVQILQCFTTARTELSSRELMDLTGLPRPTVFRTTSTLRRLGLLSYYATRGVFAPGLGLLSLAAPVLARMTIRQIARPLMQALADEAQGQVIMAVGEGPELVVAEVAQSAVSSVFRMEVGARGSLTRTVTGRAYLLGLPAEVRDAHLEQLAAEPRGQAAGKLAETGEALAANGYAIDESEYVRGLMALAAPMNADVDGRQVVFACSVPAFVADAERLGNIGLRLVAMVRSVEAAMGHVGDLSTDAAHARPATRRTRSRGAG